MKEALDIEEILREIKVGNMQHLLLDDTIEGVSNLIKLWIRSNEDRGLEVSCFGGFTIAEKDKIKDNKYFYSGDAEIVLVNLKGLTREMENKVNEEKAKEPEYEG